MPWLAYIYLIIFLLLSIAGVYDDLNKSHKVIHIGGGIASAIFVVLFVLGYFYLNIGNALGFYVFPMLVIGALYEFASVQRDLNEVSNDHYLTSRQSSYLSTLTLIFVDMLVVPGYVFGLMVGVRNANL